MFYKMGLLGLAPKNSKKNVPQRPESSSSSEPSAESTMKHCACLRVSRLHLRCWGPHTGADSVLRGKLFTIYGRRWLFDDFES